MQVEKHLCGIRMVDIANFELDSLISQIHLSRPSFPEAFSSEADFVLFARSMPRGRR
jgi:hypothetical protein